MVIFIDEQEEKIGKQLSRMRQEEEQLRKAAWEGAKD
jgi:hypothetical protein